MTNESLKSLALSYSVLKLVTKPWKTFDAYKLGLIDDKGNKLRVANTEEEKKAVGAGSRIFINLKRILQKFLGGGALAKAAITLYLLKESTYDEHKVDSIINVVLKHYYIPCISEAEEIGDSSEVDDYVNQLINEEWEK